MYLLNINLFDTLKIFIFTYLHDKYNLQCKFSCSIFFIASVFASLHQHLNSIFYWGNKQFINRMHQNHKSHSIVTIQLRNKSASFPMKQATIFTDYIEFKLTFIVVGPLKVAPAKRAPAA